MKLPEKVASVKRDGYDTAMGIKNVAPSGMACDLLCGFLPEPAKSICIQAC